MRQSRKRLKARALRAATNWLRPTHTLNKRECNERMVGAWLRGYEAARRDAAKAVRAMVGVDGTVHAGFSIVSTDDGQGEVLTIPALGSRQITCVACGWPCNSVGTCSNLGCPGLGRYRVVHSVTPITPST